MPDGYAMGSRPMWRHPAFSDMFASPYSEQTGVLKKPPPLIRWCCYHQTVQLPNPAPPISPSLLEHFQLHSSPSPPLHGHFPLPSSTLPSPPWTLPTPLHRPSLSSMISCTTLRLHNPPLALSLLTLCNRIGCQSDHGDGDGCQEPLTPPVRMCPGNSRA